MPIASTKFIGYVFVGTLVLVLAWVALADSRGATPFFIEAHESIDVYSNFDPESGLGNASKSTHRIETGEKVDLVGCKDTKSDFVPMIRMPDGSTGFVGPGMYSVRRRPEVRYYPLPLLSDDCSPFVSAK